MIVRVICEDFTQDQFILKPIIEAMFREIVKPRIKVEIVRDPALRGVGQATDWKNIEAILDRYRGMTDLFLLCVDRDGEEHRRSALNGLEKQAKAHFPGGLFLAENAWQELEVWLLAGHDTLPKEWKWAEIRAERDPKERYYRPFAQQNGVLNQPAQGRRTPAEQAAKNYARIRRLCREDIEALEKNIRAAFAAI